MDTQNSSKLNKIPDNNVDNQDNNCIKLSYAIVRIAMWVRISENLSKFYQVNFSFCIPSNVLETAYNAIKNTHI